MYEIRSETPTGSGLKARAGRGITGGVGPGQYPSRMTDSRVLRRLHIAGPLFTAAIIACEKSGEGYLRGTVTANGAPLAQVAVTGWIRPSLTDTALVGERDSSFMRTGADGRYELFFKTFLYEGPALVTLRVTPTDTMLSELVLYAHVRLDYDHPGETQLNVAVLPKP